MKKQIAFRAAYENECWQGEPKLLAKDLWITGYRRIVVVPSVNLEYSDDAGRKIKESKGYTSRWAGNDKDEEGKIEWQSEPPENVKCMPNYAHQIWVPWNEGLQPG